MEITPYLKAGYPALFISTLEPHRAIESIRPDGWKTLKWDCLRGIVDCQAEQTIDFVKDPLDALQWLAKQSETLLFVSNFHYFIESVEIVQGIQNNIPNWKANGCCLAMVGPAVQLPTEISTYFTILDFCLPSRSELLKIQTDLAENVGLPVCYESVDAALGLTEFEAETAFAFSLVQEKRFSPGVIVQQKRQMIRRTGLMEFWPPVPIASVGGLNQLKTYIENRIAAFHPDNVTLPNPKAILLLGIQGTGKSLSCKATASILNWPLIRLDISALKGSLVGESERRMRQATATIDAFGRAVVWLDEIDKVFAGVKSSGNTDGGTTAGMFGHFLTWMQETTSPILVMATANNISALPPEFMRTGRFDALFFVDLPTASERLEIIQIMNRKYHTAIPEDYAEKLIGWTGAEIEQLAKDSLFDGLETAYANIVPLSKTMKEDITALQEWATSRARKANTADPVTKNKLARRIK
ncbi:MAG: AAA family ATPase [Desulfobacteraceae bacterium]|nr:MAG: AAA family ATPase [Desulfobacteraceae bacterium]